MKTKHLMLGFIAGSVSGILVTILLIGQTATANHRHQNYSWNTAAEWPDSLDAVKAAPGNHKVVFENEKVRILEVIGEPYANEPLHTHKWPSIMWLSDSNFTNEPMIYYHYGFDPATKHYYIIDSVREQAPPANSGFEIPSEGPHRVRNLSGKKFVAYRIEFKN
jgi:hypothetical protein